VNLRLIFIIITVQTFSLLNQNYGLSVHGGLFSALEEGNRIRFKNMAVTMRACPDVDVNESEFLEVFELADNYTINGTILSLNVGRRAPLAVFESVLMN
jgi:heat shock protein HslJ